MAIVKSTTEGYNYKYASLSNIDEQGFPIPKMKTGTENGKDYIYYWDPELKEWIRGAEIIIPDSKGMNKAQLYASAVTYARRVTTQMADSLSCSDDKDIEDLKEDGTNKKTGYSPEEDDGTPATPKQIEVLKKLNVSQISNIINHFGLESIDEISKAQASETIAKIMKREVSNDK